ncbi:MAG: response regulator [Granulosicoccaceae bacterium]|jgi:PAS domain S-box-containing protein
MQSDQIRILLVEDNPADARLVQLALADSQGVSFVVTHFERLNEALQHNNADSVDAVLLDLSLPDSHGLETVKQLRAEWPAVPIVVLSGDMDEGLAVEAVKAGAQDYLVKGQGDSVLVSRAVRYAMQRKHSEEALRHAHDLLEHRVEERTADLKQANAELQEEIARRHDTETRLRWERDFNTAVMDTVSALIVVLGPDGRIIRCNRACEQATGYLTGEVHGTAMCDRLLATADNEVMNEAFTQLRAGKQPEKYETELLNKSGERRLIAWSTTVMRDAAGRVEYIITTGIDITERKQAESRARMRTLELAHTTRLSTMGEMATEIAHELNQPLTSIATYADACLRLLPANGDAPDDVRRALQDIANQAQRGGRIIRGLREFVGKGEGHRSTIDINNLVRDVVRLAEVEARWHSVKMSVALAADLPAVLLEKILIEQVLLNLIRNAIEAMEAVDKSSRQLTITSSRIPEDKICIAVQDSGPGLSEEAQQKVFERFYTTKANGMGMGLAICHSIIQEHGGKLWTTPNNPHGTTFHFTLAITTEDGQDNAT